MPRRTPPSSSTTGKLACLHDRQAAGPIGDRVLLVRGWEDADRSPRTILELSDSDYYCAPQVFYFTPHKKVVSGLPDGRARCEEDVGRLLHDDRHRRPRLRGPGPGRSSTAATNDPREVGGLDYWIICDDQRAYLFLTSLNGKMWRLWTKLEDFPRGLRPLRTRPGARFFEASHTYRLKGSDKYLTIIEENGRRYYKAYLADSLDGEWRPLADTAETPFAGWKNIRPAPGVEPWTDNVSHGELIRDGYDQTLTVDPDNLRFVFQGMWDKDKAGRRYGQFTWRIGMLTPAPFAAPRPGAAD